jgi:hypothetical protein
MTKFSPRLPRAAVKIEPQAHPADYKARGKGNSYMFGASTNH